MDWRARIAELEAENESLGLELKAALVRIEELERRLGKDSQNSGKPPSSDPPKTRADRRRKQREQRRGEKPGQGGKPGHKAKFRPLVDAEDVTRTTNLFPNSCDGCGAELPKVVDPEPERRQLAELPPVKPDVTEFRLHAVECPCCGEKTRARAPRALANGNFGPRLMATVAMLTGVYHVSRRDAVALLREMFGLHMSLGGVSKIEGRVARALQAPVTEATEYVLDQVVKHVDATTWRQAGDFRSLWTMATSLMTVFAITANGTQKALREVVRRVKGILVSDRGSQFGFWAMELRQICWAHLLRKFAELSQGKGEAGRIGEALVLLAQALFHELHRVRDGTGSKTELKEFVTNLAPHVEHLLERGSALGVRGVSKACDNILAHRHALWTFATEPGVEPTNNHAERELRRFVMWRRRCFGSQSDRGDRYAERVMTVAHSLRKQHRDPFEFLTATLAAQVRRIPPPSLLPITA